MLITYQISKAKTMSIHKDVYFLITIVISFIFLSIGMNHFLYLAVIINRIIEIFYLK